MKKDIFLALTLVIVSLLAGCTTTPSKTITTIGFYPTYRATSDGTNITLFASFQVGGQFSNTFIYMSDGDSISATNGTSRVTLTKQTGILGQKYYSGTLPGGQAGKTVTFQLNRSAEASAPNSTAVIPPAFSISSPLPGASYSRATDAISVAWAPSGSIDAMWWDVSCPGHYTEASVVGDPGVLSIEAGALLASPPSAETGEATLTLCRKRVGNLDSAFASGGVIEGIQERKITFNSIP